MRAGLACRIGARARARKVTAEESLMGEEPRRRLARLHGEHGRLDTPEAFQYNPVAPRERTISGAPTLPQPR